MAMMAARRPMAPAARGNGNMMAANPAAFNRVARLQRQKVGAITHSSGVSGRILELPNVGYHYRSMLFTDLDLGTTGGAPTARFLGGAFGATAARFAGPHSILRALRYTLNVSSPIYYTDGYGNYILQLVNNRGIDPWTVVASGAYGRNRKERATYCILNSTTGALVAPDTALAAATNYKIRAVWVIPLTLGEIASAGLIPVQDIRITPQIIVDMGDRTDLVTVAGDISEPAGNYTVIQDYFTVPTEGVRPDTDFVMQTRQDVVSVTGTGEQIYRPQIGGIILRACLTVWNNSRAIDPVTQDGTRLRIQQGIQLEQLIPQVRVMDERRWYSKLMPDEVTVYDHIAGFGDPTLPSLRDRVASNQLTRLEYIFDWATATAISGTAELRCYLQQLIPLPRV